MLILIKNPTRRSRGQLPRVNIPKVLMGQEGMEVG